MAVRTLWTALPCDDLEAETEALRRALRPLRGRSGIQLPYVDHIAAQVRGRLGTGGEIWTCSMRFGGGTNAATVLPNPTTDHADDILRDWRKCLTAMVGASGAAKADQVRMYRIPTGSNGVSTGRAPIAVSTLPDDPSTMPTTIAAPLSTCVVATLDTPDRTRPRTGRFFIPYVPAAGLVINSTGRFAPGAMPNLLAPIRQLVVDLNNWPGLDSGFNAVLAIYSKGGKDGPTARQKRVSGVRVGDVLDNMHSRRAQLSEVYQVGVAV